MLSWTGLYGNMTLNQTLHQLYRINMDDIEVLKKNQELERIKEDNITTRFTIANGLCRVLEITPREIGRLDIGLKGDDSFKVFINDPENTNGLFFSQISGDRLVYDSKEGKEVHTFLIHLKETQDKTGLGSCIEYPNSHYETFSQCIKDDIVKKTTSVFGFGLPFFSESNKTIEPIQKQQHHEATIKWLWSISVNSFGAKVYKPDSCLPPCSILTAISEQQQKYSFTSCVIDFYFDDVGQVQTTVLAYGFDALLVEIGSSLGLWLGLSLVGMYDLLTAVVEKLMKWIAQSTPEKKILMKDSSGKDSNQAWA